MKTLTIVVPSYNVEKYLPETIPTFLQPEILEDLEILIVNDGSKDRTSEIAESYHRMYPKTVFVLNKENGGHGSTINMGIQYATGKYFRVVDGDDWVDPKSFISFVLALRTLSVDLVLTPYNFVHMDSKNVELKGFKGVEAEREYDFDEIINKLGMHYSIHTATYKTELIKKIPALSEHCFYVDTEYICYALSFVKTAEVLDYVVYQYRVGNPEQSVSWNNIIKNRNMHKHVIKQILRFYSESEVSEKKRCWLEFRCRLLIHNQFRIYFHMPINKTSIEESAVFLKEMKAANDMILNSVDSRAVQIIVRSNNRLFFLASSLAKAKDKWKMIKEKASA